MKLETRGTEQARMEPTLVGALTLAEVRLYQDLIRRRVLTSERGGSFQVSFNGTEAIKHPFKEERDSPERRADLLWNYQVGKDLKIGGAQVPMMRGVYVGEGIPLLAMEAICDLTPVDKLRGKQRQEAERQYKEQIALIERLGYCPSDVQHAKYKTNCGFHRTRGEKGTLFFFDFKTYRRIN